MGVKTVRGGRERLWELRFAPLWVVVPVCVRCCWDSRH